MLLFDRDAAKLGATEVIYAGHGAQQASAVV